MSVKKILIISAASLILIVLIFFARTLGVSGLFYSANFIFPPHPPSDSVVIVGIDARSIEQIGGWPWSRSTLATLFQRIESAQPRTVALDFLFPPRPDDSLGNDSLAHVFERIHSLVLPFKLGAVSDTPDGSASVPADVFRNRFAVISNAAGLADHFFFNSAEVSIPDTMFARHASYGGFLNVKSSQKLYDLVHVMVLDKEYYPSFAIAATAAYLDLKSVDLQLDGAPAIKLGDRTIPLNSQKGESVFLNFRGKPGTIRTISAADILLGHTDTRLLSRCLVFVGVTEPGIVSDFLVTPVAANFPGVEVWATAATDLLQGTWVIYGGGFAGMLGGLLIVLIFPGLALLVPARRRILSVVIGAGIAIGSVILCFLLFRVGNYFWDPTGHIAAFVFVLLWMAMQKIDPSLSALAGLTFEPDNDSLDLDQLIPATKFIDHIPDIDTARHVASGLRSGKPIFASSPGGTMIESGVSLETEFNMVESFRELHNGTIVRVLGSGGMADVYLVWNNRMEVYRAIKVLKPELPQNVRERFETEIRIVSHFTHPNIVQCFGVGDWHGLPCLEMEYVNGKSLEEIIPVLGALKPEEAVAIGILVCRALQYAHSQVVTIFGTTYRGVIHRDLKPANIMLSRSGQIKLTDFGIARPTEVSINTIDSGMIVGTLPYLAPEQADGKDITTKADQYALGATLHELLAGERAFPQREVTALLSAKVAGKIKPIDTATAPPVLTSIIKKAMAQSPADRYESASEMALELEKAYRVITKKSGSEVIAGLASRARQ